MREVAVEIPDPDVLLQLTPEELGAKLLFLIRKRNPNGEKFNPYNYNLELWNYNTLPGSEPPYGSELREKITLALNEAWGWLIAQGLVILAMETISPDWYHLSRRALAFEDPKDFAKFAVARMLQKEVLHPRIANVVWQAFMRSEFDTAVFQSMKAVEVSVRQASGLPESLVGVPLMRKAFDPESGKLTDMQAEKGEREACSGLFAGAIGMYKNPQSHRDVNLDNPAEAVEIIMMANNLPRIVEVRAKLATATAP